MRFPRYIVLTLLFFIASLSSAADKNNYTAYYECRAGGAYCSIDVASLGKRSCDQTITTSTKPSNNWSAIDWSHDTICIQAGDHTGRGTLTITANGKPNKHKVLRYVRKDDKNDQPWKQSPNDRATIRQLDVKGSHWLVHRLDIDPTQNVGSTVTGTGVIYDRMWIHNANARRLLWVEGSDFVLQNSVLHDTGIPGKKADLHCVHITGGTTNLSFVSNEIFNCAGDGIQKNRGNPTPNLIVENNDIYLTSAYYSDGKGKLKTNGPRACAENALDFKNGGGSASTPVRVTHNRLWGFRHTDINCGGTGSNGDAIIINEATADGIDNAYGSIDKNIIMDSAQGITAANGSPRNWSINGNMFFDMRGPDKDTGGTIVNLNSSHDIEVYLNTFIDVAKGNSKGWIKFGNNSNKDIQCNAVVDGGRSSDINGGNIQVDHQVYYNSSKADENQVIDLPVKTRANSKSYKYGDVMRSGAVSDCKSISDSACYLYMASTSGTSASSTPVPCTSLGCTFKDGGVRWIAIRGPYTFYRKLLTKPMLTVVPYARPYADPYDPSLSAPEAYACPPNFAARRGVGLDDLK